MYKHVGIKELLVASNNSTNHSAAAAAYFPILNYGIREMLVSTNFGFGIKGVFVAS